MPCLRASSEKKARFTEAALFRDPYAVLAADAMLDDNATAAMRFIARGLLADPQFRKGFACLGPLGLTFDAWLFHPQIGELADLARACPNQRIIMDHCGGPVGLGAYAKTLCSAVFVSGREMPLERLRAAMNREKVAPSYSTGRRITTRASMILR